MITLRASADPPSFAGSRLVAEADGRVVGTCGLLDGSPEHRRALAYVDVEDAYRKETLRTLCRWAFDDVNLAKVEANVRNADLPLYQSVGFVREVRRVHAVWADGGWHDEHLVGVFPEELR